MGSEGPCISAMISLYSVKLETSIKKHTLDLVNSDLSGTNEESSPPTSEALIQTSYVLSREVKVLSKSGILQDGGVYREDKNAPSPSRHG